MYFIGDVHGHYKRYREIVHQHSPTIQVGDFGFDYSILNGVDPSQHRVLGGNHDNYDDIHKFPHYLGDYGLWKDIFFIRGANSIDQHCRTEGVDWWRKEELTYLELQDALERYQQVKTKIKIVVSHECPTSVIDFLTRGYIPSRTDQFLQCLFEIHQPELWVFGHYHIRAENILNGTRFVCLEELGVFHDCYCTFSKA